MSEELSRKLKSARAKLGITQTQAAQVWGIPYKTLLSWEQNVNTPRGFALTAILEKLDAILADPPPAKKRGSKAQ
jgi:DNA-binding transcriptional regulator YiaG